MSRRNDFAIMSDVLKLANGVYKTRLVYGGNLNFTLIDKYLKTLTSRGLIEKQETGKRAKYFTTEKGKVFLKRFNSLLKQM